MTTVRILADDLTGAIDSGARFAGAAGRVPVYFGTVPDDPPEAFGVDSETRDSDAPGAVQCTAALSWILRCHGLALKKIDSLLRGNVASELSALVEPAWFRSVVIAPAFPRQLRISRAGRIWWLAPGQADWQRLDVDLIGELRERGIRVRRPVVPQEIEGEGAFFCDAEAETDLAAIVEQGARLTPPTLWCGSAGLAGALAASVSVPTSTALGHVRPTLAILGTTAPSTLLQLAVLDARRPNLVRRIDAGDVTEVAAAADLAARRIAQDASAVLAITPATNCDAVTARRSIAAAVRIVAERVPPPAALLVSGGATYFDLARALGVGRADVLGELSPGIPVSCLVGGRWNGVNVISKSGSFGDAQMLADLMCPAEVAHD